MLLFPEEQHSVAGRSTKNPVCGITKVLYAETATSANGKFKNCHIKYQHAEGPGENRDLKMVRLKESHKEKEHL